MSRCQEGVAGPFWKGGSSNGLHWAQLHTNDVHDPRAIAATFLTEWEHARPPVCPTPVHPHFVAPHGLAWSTAGEKRPRALEPPLLGFRRALAAEAHVELSPGQPASSPPARFSFGACVGATKGAGTGKCESARKGCVQPLGTPVLVTMHGCGACLRCMTS